MNLHSADYESVALPLSYGPILLSLSMYYIRQR
ncbi:hypothetical protein VPHD148_0171 [Vibrio phage D148]